MRLAAVTIHCPADSRRMEWLADQAAVLEGELPWQPSEDRFREGVWPNFRRAGELMLEQNPTHVLFLQDDVRLCRNFVAGCHRLLELRPQHLVCLFNMRPKVVELCGKHDTLWFVDPDGVYTHALLCPIEMLADFLAWERQHVAPDFPHDDRRWSMWMRFAEGSPEMVWNVAESLVQHVGAKHSLMGHNGRRPDAPRVCEDALAVDWSHGIDRPYRATSTSDVKKNLMPWYLP